MVEADLFEELVEPVETAARVVGVAAGTALAFALMHPASPLHPRPFYFLLALATGVAAFLHSLRKARTAEEKAKRAAQA